MYQPKQNSRIMAKHIHIHSQHPLTEDSTHSSAVTAAHCIIRKGEQNTTAALRNFVANYVVYAGLYDSCASHEFSRQMAEIKEAVLHPNYAVSSSSPLGNGSCCESAPFNLAIVILKQPFRHTSDVRPIAGYFTLNTSTWMHDKVLNLKEGQLFLVGMGNINKT